MLSPWTTSAEAVELAKMVQENSADLGETIDRAVGYVLAELQANKKDLARTVQNGKRFANKLVRQNQADLESSLGPALAMVQGAVVENGIELRQAELGALTQGESNGTAANAGPPDSLSPEIGQAGTPGGLVRSGQQRIPGGGFVGAGAEGADTVSTGGSESIQGQEIGLTLGAGAAPPAIGDQAQELAAATQLSLAVGCDPPPCPNSGGGGGAIAADDFPFCAERCFYRPVNDIAWQWIQDAWNYANNLPGAQCQITWGPGPANVPLGITVKVCCKTQAAVTLAFANTGLQPCIIIGTGEPPCDPAARAMVQGQCFFCSCEPPADFRCTKIRMPDGAWKVCCHQLDQVKLADWWKLSKCGPFYSCDPKACETQCKPDCGACPVDCRKAAEQCGTGGGGPGGGCCPNVTCPPPKVTIDNKLSCPPPVIEFKPVINVTVDVAAGGGDGGGGPKPVKEPCLPEGDPSGPARYWFDPCYDEVRGLAMSYLGIGDFAGPDKLDNLSANRFTPIEGGHIVSSG